MGALANKTVVVAGGTGNVGSFIVRSLLDGGATVVVPSRSETRFDSLRAHLSPTVDEKALDRLLLFVGDVADEYDGDTLRRQIVDRVGVPDAIVATLGGPWHSVSSLLSARAADLERVIRDYLIAHYKVARTFLPDLKSSGGIYVFVNGPLAFDIWSTESALVSIATAGQHMLFRALADELAESPAQVAELVTHAYIRNRKTQPSSNLPGEAVGVFAAHLVSGGAGKLHGQTIHLRSLDQLDEAGLVLEDSPSLASAGQA